jgi:hypothetical protein
LQKNKFFYCAVLFINNNYAESPKRQCRGTIFFQGKVGLLIGLTWLCVKSSIHPWCIFGKHRWVFTEILKRDPSCIRCSISLRVGQIVDYSLHVHYVKPELGVYVWLAQPSWNQLGRRDDWQSIKSSSTYRCRSS